MLQAREPETSIEAWRYSAGAGNSFRPAGCAGWKSSRRNGTAKTVLALAVRWVLDAGQTIALWGARTPEQLAPVNEAFDWPLDSEAKHTIDRILAETIKDPVGPEFMAPPVKRVA